MWSAEVRRREYTVRCCLDMSYEDIWYQVCSDQDGLHMCRECKVCEQGGKVRVRVNRSRRRLNCAISVGTGGNEEFSIKAITWE